MKRNQIKSKREKLNKNIKGGRVSRGREDEKGEVGLPQIGSIEDDRRNTLVGDVPDAEPEVEDKS